MADSPITAGTSDPVGLSATDRAAVLEHGTLELVGRLTDASNVSLVAHASLNGVTLPCVYKPVRGERPLWDFPDGTLAGREVAAALVAQAAGWDCVPPTLLRPGPLGEGMVQLWITQVEDAAAVDLFPAESVPDGWLPVLQAVDEDDRPLVLAHRDSPALALLAAFDEVVNNADRKGSHILTVGEGHYRGVDHGLTMHADDKVRTVLWGWAGQPLTDQARDGLGRLVAALTPDSELTRSLEDLLTMTEIGALLDRVTALQRAGTHGLPPATRTAIPWPAL